MPERKKCLVFGNGKSLENFNFKLINREQYDIIGCCLAFRYWDKIDWFPDIYVNVDKVVLTKNPDVKEWIKQKKCKCYILSEEIKKIWMDYPKDGTILFIEDLMNNCNSMFKLVRNWCSGTAAVMTALDNYLDIKLAGFDCDYVEFIPESQRMPDGSLRIKKTPANNPNYFFNDYQRKGDYYNKPNGKSIHLRSWKELGHILEYLHNMYPEVPLSLKNYNDKYSIRDHIKTYPLVNMFKK